MDGVETFHGIRKIYSYAPVAMMTGFALKAQRSETLQKRALDILAQPG